MKNSSARAMWSEKTPHFGGTAPHRYDPGETQCSYCRRPIDFVPGLRLWTSSQNPNKLLIADTEAMAVKLNDGIQVTFYSDVESLSEINTYQVIRDKRGEPIRVMLKNGGKF